MKPSDRFLDWTFLDESSFPIERELTFASQSIVQLTERISYAESEEFGQNMARRDDLIHLLHMELDRVYEQREHLLRVKAMWELGLGPSVEFRMQQEQTFPPEPYRKY